MRLPIRFRHLASAASAAVVAVVTLVAMLGINSVAQACSHAPPAPPTLCIQQLDATHYCILIKNYNTGGGALPGQFCTCALKKLGPIISIDSFQIRGCDGGVPIPGWSFQPNANSSNAWQAILLGQATGFLSSVSTPIGGQRCIDLYFIVTVGPGTPATTLASALAAGGNIVGNGEASSNGVPLPGSFEFRPSGPITILPGAGTGACCVGTSCSVTASTACLGTFQGLNTVCGTAANPTTCCPANFNGVGGLSVQDIFDFLGAWFAGNPSANFNGVNGITVQDIFDFLAAWFAGC